MLSTFRYIGRALSDYRKQVEQISPVSRVRWEKQLRSFLSQRIKAFIADVGAPEWTTLEIPMPACRTTLPVRYVLAGLASIAEGSVLFRSRVRDRELERGSFHAYRTVGLADDSSLWVGSV